MIFLRNPAKNLIKIRSLGPILGLMSTRKKCIHLYKFGNGILAYYRGEVLPGHQPTRLARSGAPRGAPFMLHARILAQCCIFSRGNVITRAWKSVGLNAEPGQIWSVG